MILISGVQSASRNDFPIMFLSGGSKPSVKLLISNQFTRDYNIRPQNRFKIVLKSQLGNAKQL